MDVETRQETTSGVDLIAAERRRQIEAEGWTSRRDDKQVCGELASAAACYAIPAEARTASVEGYTAQLRLDLLRWLWPWADIWWKPTPENRIKELAKAGALIAAEIDRLQRLATPATGEREEVDSVCERIEVVECCATCGEPKSRSNQPGEECERDWPVCINPMCPAFGEAVASARFRPRRVEEEREAGNRAAQEEVNNA